MINVPSPQEKLQVQVWDWDRVGHDDFMGECFLSLAALQPSEPCQFWTPLFDKNKEQGEIHLELTYFPIG